MNQGMTFEEIVNWTSLQYHRFMEETHSTGNTVQQDELPLLEDATQEKEKMYLIQPVKGVITSPFGNRTSDNPSISSYHTGIDIATQQETPILASHEGIVTEVGENESYGNFVMLTSGELTTLYAHCFSINVEKGEYVKQGQTIAKVGMTGNATGPHVHFEVRKDGQFVDPLAILQEEKDVN